MIELKKRRKDIFFSKLSHPFLDFFSKLNTRRSGRGAELHLSEQSCANAGVTFSWPAWLTQNASETPTIPCWLNSALFSLRQSMARILGRTALKIAPVLGNHFNLRVIILICVIGSNFVFQSIVNALPIWWRWNAASWFPSESPLQLGQENHSAMTGPDTTIRMLKVQNVDVTTMRAKMRSPSRRRRGSASLLNTSTC